MGDPRDNKKKVGVPRDNKKKDGVSRDPHNRKMVFPATIERLCSLRQ